MKKQSNIEKLYKLAKNQQVSAPAEVNNTVQEENTAIIDEGRVPDGSADTDTTEEDGGYEFSMPEHALEMGIGAGVGGLGGYGLASLLTKNQLARALAALAGAGIGGYGGSQFHRLQQPSPELAETDGV